MLISIYIGEASGAMHKLLGHKEAMSLRRMERRRCCTHAKGEPASSLGHDQEGRMGKNRWRTDHRWGWFVGWNEQRRVGERNRGVHGTGTV